MKKIFSIIFALIFVANTFGAKQLTAVNLIVMRTTGMHALVLGYDDGTLELRNWKGDKIASRKFTSKITAMKVDHGQGTALPRIFVASSESSGTIRVIDPADLATDLAKKTGTGTVQCFNVRQNWLYAGTSGGTLWKLDNKTLAQQAKRTGFGSIKYVSDSGNPPDAYSNIFITSTNSGGSIYRLKYDTLATLGSKSSIGTITGFTCNDWVDADYFDIYLVISAESGTLKKLNGQTFATEASKTSVGNVNFMCAGYPGLDPDSEPTLVICDTTGTLRTWKWNGTAFLKVKYQTSLGSIVEAAVDDLYQTDAYQIVYFCNKSGKVMWYIRDEAMKLYNYAIIAP
ncbi:MAG: hypothetical protein A2Y12_13985 [Planctomycetes bacterium GWF2_42_9]|nr:MAG: hypothetical protein A2Y12_13985 [Planctomycetes bacterium GWF2_42_9]